MYAKPTERAICGKIIFCMETDPNSVTSSAPRMISSFVTGFNSVASNIYLILLPVLLDLLLWFGPHLRIKNLLQPVINDMVTNLKTVGSPEMVQMASVAQTLWQVTIDRFNLLSLLHTVPIGVPSLLVSIAPLKTPYGNAPLLEISSLGMIAGLWLLAVLVGLVLASFYFDSIARVTMPEKKTFSMKHTARAAFQIILLNLILIGIGVVLFIPVTLMVSLITLISPFLAQIFMLLIALFLLWLLVPLIFTPHGIFSNQQNVLAAILNSIRLVRFFLPGTGLFLVLAVLLGQGLDVLWRVPAEDSWMILVGIAGHAFISTGLLAASFTYYSSGMRRMQDTLKNINTAGL
jgi:hypothetical protein